MSLDPKQIEAVEFYKGPALVIAGPGSGKTTVLTKRVARLIEQWNVSPHRILVITFTKSAAIQMKQRFTTISKGFYPVTFCTFHSLFYSIIRDSDKNHFSIISPQEKVNILKESLMFNGADTDSVNIQALLDEFARITNSHINLYDFVSTCLTKDMFIKVYISYLKEKNNLYKIDYDDFASVANDILRNPDILNQWQNKFDFLLIDEFQDVNVTQYELIKKIFINGNIYAVGDEDQSIYGFRGSSPDICFKFIEEYNASKFYLTNNYRSFSEIVNKSSILIKHNKNRFDKEFVANKSDSRTHFMLSFASDYDSLYSELVNDLIKKYKKGESIAILARTNSFPPSLIKKLNDSNISIKRNKLSQGLNQEFINDLCAYIKIALGEKTIRNLLRIYNKPNRYISRTFINEIKNQAGEYFNFNDVLKLARGQSYLIKAIYVLERHLSELSRMDSYEGIIFIMKVIDYESYLRINKIKYEDDYKIIKDYARENSDLKDFVANLENLNSVELKENNNDKYIDCVTMHASKGLEWDNVYIIDLQEGILPHKKCGSIAELEEERRLMYVAMTRARNYLWMGYVKNDSAGVIKSLFIDEIS